MKKYLFIIFAGLSLTFGACSKKTTPPSDENTTVNRRANGPERSNQGKPEFSTLLSQMDGNGDGLLSRKEVKGPLKDSFSQIDKDGNGLISKTEFASAPPPKRRARRRN